MQEEYLKEIENLEKSILTGLGTSYQVFIPSLGKDISFRHLSVDELKRIAKVMIGASTIKDQLDLSIVMIKTCCLESEQLDLNLLTELDRQIINNRIVEENNLIPEYDVDCKHCGALNKITPSGSKIDEYYRSTDFSNETFSNFRENEIGAEIKVPSLRTLRTFLEYLEKEEVEEDDISMCWISKLEIQFKNKEVDNILYDSETDNIIKVIKMVKLLPLDLIRNDTQNLIEILNKKVEDMYQIPSEKCMSCGKDLEVIASAENFLS